MLGDPTLFTRTDEVENAWRFITPILDAWEHSDEQPEFYAAGTWGPEAADALLARDGNRWRKSEARFVRASAEPKPGHHANRQPARGRTLAGRRFVACNRTTAATSSEVQRGPLASGTDAGRPS